MARNGTKKPVVYFADAVTITSWGDNSGYAQATFASDSDVTTNDHMLIDGSTSLDGYLKVLSISGLTVTFDVAYVSQASPGTGQKCWDMELDDTNVYYDYSFETALIINESPINGHISRVNLARNDDEGRYSVKMEINNMTSSQILKYKEMVYLGTVDILLHEDSTTLSAMTFVITSVKDFQGENYPLIDNALIELIAEDYEELK